MAVNSFREDEKLQATDKKKIVRRLFGYLKGYKAQIVLVLLAMGATVGINLVSPQIVKYAIDEFAGGAEQFDDITMLGLTYFGEEDGNE